MYKCALARYRSQETHAPLRLNGPALCFKFPRAGAGAPPAGEIWAGCPPFGETRREAVSTDKHDGRELMAQFHACMKVIGRQAKKGGKVVRGRSRFRSGRSRLSGGTQALRRAQRDYAGLPAQGRGGLHHHTHPGRRAGLDARSRAPVERGGVQGGREQSA